MDRLEAFMERLDKGHALTNYECLRLVMIAQRAASFTDANDRGDDISDKLGGGYGDDEDRLLDESDQADDDYNRSKDELFCAMRELMGWPGRPAKYLPEHLGGGPVLPHTFEQEGPE